MRFGSDRAAGPLASGCRCFRRRSLWCTSRRTVRSFLRRFPRRFPRRLSSMKTRGQMVVELAVCIPVILAFVGVSLSVLGYLNVCARFDRIAADAVRSQATSPGYGQEGTALSASRVREVIDSSFQGSSGSGFDCDIAVSVVSVGFGGEHAGSETGLNFSMLSRLDRYDCTITYHPWPFSRIVFLQFFELTHTRSYTVDCFNPGVLL